MREGRSPSRARLFAALGVLVVLVLAVQPASAKVGGVLVPFPYATPVFGLAMAPDGRLLVADYGAGIVELRKGAGKLIADLPAVTDIAPIGSGSMFAVTGEPFAPVFADTAQKLYRVSRGTVREVADLFAFEAAVNPAGGTIESNPFDVAALSGGRALVADAAGNDLLIVDRRGNVDWVATFPNELMLTAPAKTFVGCPTPPPGFGFVCGLPPIIPAQPVATSVAVGPDGAYYVGELKGVPAPTGASKVWRIEPGTRHAVCGIDPACTVFADGFTSIVDLTFGPDGTLYVVELDEASWLAVELVPFLGPGILAGGTVNACNLDSGSCAVVPTGLPILPMPIAATIGRDGTVFVLIWVLVPGLAEVIALP